MIYHSNSIFGVFTLGHSSDMSESFTEPNASFFFSLQKNETMEMKTVVLNSTVTFYRNNLTFCFSSYYNQKLSLNFEESRRKER